MIRTALLLILIKIWLLTVPVFTDTPANCTYEDARGKWNFYVSSYNLNCSLSNHTTEITTVNLLYPDVAVDMYGNSGRWTLIYNQGFEVTVNHRKWLTMFAFGPDGVSHCYKSIPSWSHDTLIRQWNCFYAVKAGTHESLQTSAYKKPPQNLNQRFQTNQYLVNSINSVQKLWTAYAYPELSMYTLTDIKRLAGGTKSLISWNTPKMSFKYPSKELLFLSKSLPTEFDWRKPPGGLESPITPVRNQGSCGSCYAFASAAALEARIRLASNFTRQPILSPQDIVNCSPYSEGCEGGFPYLIAGKYAEDFGFVEEKCTPYVGIKAKCNTSSNCVRYYSTDYTYVGGYYGATNEHLMQLELVQNGPFPVGFEVYDDFFYYKGGIYHHTNLKDTLNRFEPFELTNHAVLLVGYGVENANNEPYWIVKNSWGTGWGEEGYFRIRRGSDECAIESLAVRFDPVL